MFEQALASLESELTAQAIRVRADYATSLPRLRLDPRALKHVLINLLATEINGCPPGSEFYVRTYLRAPAAGPNGKSTVVAEIEARHPAAAEAAVIVAEKPASGTSDDFGIMVSRKIIELYGGKVECQRQRTKRRFTISFQT